MTFPTWPIEQRAHYTAYRAAEPIAIDGRLDEPSWLAAPRSPRFRDMTHGGPAVHDTRAAVLWDDTNLYVGFWIEEPFVEATLKNRDDPIYQNNDVEVFIAGQDTYYEFEINAYGTVYEVLFVWEDAYERDGYDQEPGLARDAPGAQPFYGVGLKDHPRGPRMGFFQWDLPGMQSAVHIDGTLNDNSDRDRGWTVELAFPWSGMDLLTRGDGRAVPPNNGDTWGMDFSRFNQYREAPPAQDNAGWCWSPHGIMDSHIPEVFTQITFSTQTVPETRS